MIKLKSKQIEQTRLELRQKQVYKCALCQIPVSEDKAVLDHSHVTGAVRATLHRGCNSLLGKLENNYKRYGVSIDDFAHNVGAYLKLHKKDQHGLIHPTFKTPEEKRVLAKKRRARKNVK